MTVGQRIQELRKKANLTQTEFATMIGYSDKSAVSKIERDKLDINQSTVIKIAQALNTTPAVILGWDEKQNSEPAETDPLINAIMNMSPQKRELITLIMQLDQEQLKSALDYARFLLGKK